MKQIILASFIAVYCFACNSNAGSSSPQFPEQSYEETKLSLEDQERQSPLNFVKSEGTYRTNLIGQYVLEGNIVNSASAVTFKDVTLRISFYSATQTLLGTEDKTIYDYVAPHESKVFKVKTNGYRDTESIGYQVVNAIPAN